MHIVRRLASRITASVEVRSRTASALASIALLCSASCGVRTAVSAEADWEDPKDDGGQVLACGYGPPCNPRNFGGQSCTSLGLKPGALSCDPETCFLVLTGCGKTTTGSSGSGGSGGAAPMPGATPFDAGALFGGLFGAGTGAGTPGGGTGAMPGGLPMDDEDGGTPGFFGNGFFGGNPGMGFFGGNPGMGIFGGQNNPNADEADPAN